MYRARAPEPTPDGHYELFYMIITDVENSARYLSYSYNRIIIRKALAKYQKDSAALENYLEKLLASSIEACRRVDIGYYDNIACVGKLITIANQKHCLHCKLVEHDNQFWSYYEKDILPHITSYAEFFVPIELVIKWQALV